MTDLAHAVLEESVVGLKAMKKLADSALAQATDDDLFRSLDGESNSIAVIMRHCAGNMRSRWRDFLTTDGEKPDRQRDQEFEPPPVRSRDAVVAEWEAGWDLAISTVESLNVDDLLRTVSLNGERMTVLTAIGRGVRHYATHVGQIIMLVKHFRGSQWQSISIPRGRSQEFLARMRK